MAFVPLLSNEKRSQLTNSQQEWLHLYEARFFGNWRPRNEPYTLKSLAYISLIDSDTPNIQRKLARKLTPAQQVHFLFHVRHDLTYRRRNYGSTTPITFWDEYITNIYLVHIKQVKLIQHVEYLKVRFIEHTVRELFVDIFQNQYGVNLGGKFAERVLKILVRQTRYLPEHELLVDVATNAANYLRTRIADPEGPRVSHYTNRHHVIERMGWNPRRFHCGQHYPELPDVDWNVHHIASFNRRPWEVEPELCRRLNEWIPWEWTNYYLPHQL